LIEIGLMVLEEKFFFSNINACKYGFPIVAPPDPGNHNVNNSESTLYVNMTYSGSVVLEKKILK
jgi:hypothetical protein